MNSSKPSQLAHLLIGLAVSLNSFSLSAQVKKDNLPTGDVKTTLNWPLSTMPGKAKSSLMNNQLTLSNQLIKADWSIKNGSLQLISFTDLKNGKTLNFGGISAYGFETISSGIFNAGDFVVTSRPQLVALMPNAKGPRVADGIAGKAIRLTLFNQKSRIVINWQAELRDGSNYIRQVFAISSKKELVDTISGISMFRLPIKYLPANSLGTVPGSPYSIPSTTILAAIEQPAYIAKSDPGAENVTTLFMPTTLSLSATDHYQISTMIGVFPEQQRRRTFQYYLERERASPFRQYLHYNSWYDLGGDLSEEKLIKTARAYQAELVQERGIKLDGFVLDDGWDDPSVDLWSPDQKRFNNGFSDLQKKLGDIKIGLWVSPYGGYGGKKERLAWAIKKGALPKNATTFDMGNIGYYNLYKQICADFMDKYAINYFKWDNAAPYENSGRTFGNLKSTGHFMRLCQVAQELHAKNPKLFINTTVGTWPSPFWLNFVDCTWRMGGADVSWIGKGDNRERGMNYRDGEMYKMVVERAPLYPINSMMVHGVVLGHYYQAKKTSEAGNNMTNEFRSYFALGTNLQELYLSPDLMNKKAWDDLAECIRWSKKNVGTLIDTHWVLGDPNKGEPYCYASWQDNKAVLCMRNPSDQEQKITIDIENAFELPPNAARKYQLRSPYQDQRIKAMEATAGKPITFVLQPFEVLVFDAVANGVK
ncbi:alpha-galactosidase [Pedobacter borealis]|uniref:alpha-galactosidase n=1 Tax=Pedobacter borealis TaxID=475254 RepID=UPI0004937121|nr:alpha-galactosidase [Pedobacter borealis]